MNRIYPNRAVVALCVVLTVVFPFFAEAAESPFRVVSSGADGVTFVFSLPEWSLTPVENGGRNYSRIEVAGAETLRRSGFPPVPVFTAVLATPPGANVSGSSSPGERTVLRVSGLEPVVLDTRGEDDGTPVTRHEAFSEEYLSGGEYPSQVVTISAPERLRDYRIVRVTVSPFSTDPATGALTVRREVTVNLSFSHDDISRDRLASAGAVPAEAIYRGLFLNWRDAGAWRQGPATGAALSASPFDNAPRWAAVRIDSSAVYSLSGAYLKSNGVDLTGTSPASIRLFSGPGLMLPEEPSEPESALREVAIRVTGAADGTFDAGDRIIFFGQGLDRFTVDDTGAVGSVRHRYDNHAVYWLAWGDPSAAGLRMAEHVSPSVSGAQTINSAERRFHFERNTQYFADLQPDEPKANPAPDYWAWVEEGDSDGLLERNFDLKMQPLPTGSLLRCQFYGSRVGAHSWNLRLNGRTIVSGVHLSVTARTTAWLPLPEGTLIEGQNALSLTGNNLALGYFELRVSSPLRLSAGERMLFHSRVQSGQALQISGEVSRETEVYDITEPFRPVFITGLQSEAGVGVRFVPPFPGGTMRSFAALADSAWAVPVSVRRVEPSGLRNLSGAEYVVIAPHSLADRARILTDRRASGYSTLLVSVEDIRDEFAFGLSDPAAIRNFLHHAYRNWPLTPRFAVLFGDGHNDYRGYTSTGRLRPNHIPPYITNQDVALDEWFVRFESDGLPQIALGRLPVQTSADAAVVVDKIIRYDEGRDPGDWVRRVVLVADDGYVSGGACDLVTNHVPGSEELDSLLPGELERKKVYLDRYPFDPPEIGTRKPAANRDLLETWNRGALLVNYLGHGGSSQWSQERVFDVEQDLPMLINGYRLPLVLNSSCSIGHFDDYRADAMAERLLTHPGGGAIAVYAATRVTYAGQNLALNRLLVRNLFSDEHPTIGEAAQFARAGLGALERGNAERYVLFGDPAQRLRSPARSLLFSLEHSGEIKPGEKVDFSGTVRNPDGAVDVSFSGVAGVTFESGPSPVTISYRCNWFGTTIERAVDFVQPGGALFNGSVTVGAGHFNGAFVLPLNLVSSFPSDSLASGSGRFAGYATSELNDAAGIGADVLIATRGVSLSDSSGPGIKLFHRGRELSDGDRIGVDEPLEVSLSDESGINTTGRPGYQIAVEVNEGTTYAADLTSLFRYRTDSWQEGTVSVDLRQVGEGLHSFRFRASDNALNTSRVELMLYVSGGGGTLSLRDVLNYPNPFRDETDICFELGAPADVLVRIFSVAGRPVKELRLYGASAGFNRIRWDGTDEYQQKVANGVYLYKIICRSNLNTISGTEEVEATGKALFSR